MTDFRSLCTEGPSDEEITKLAVQHLGYLELPPDYREIEASRSELIAFARAVLARFRASQLHPVSVSERLPGPEDLDDSGRCWLFSKVAKEWRLIDVRNPGVPHLKYCFSHWLPTHDLPLPEVTPDTYLLSDAG